MDQRRCRDSGQDPSPDAVAADLDLPLTDPKPVLVRSCFGIGPSGFAGARDLVDDFLGQRIVGIESEQSAQAGDIIGIEFRVLDVGRVEQRG